MSAGKGDEAYACVTKFDCEDQQVDLYYFLTVVLVGKVLFENIWTLLVVNGKTTRFVSTRWLSLEICCDKELKKYEALKSMFLARDEKEGRLDTDDGSESKKIIRHQ